jgi:prophage DNA circulation protein
MRVTINLTPAEDELLATYVEREAPEDTIHSYATRLLTKVIRQVLAADILAAVEANKRRAMAAWVAADDAAKTASLEPLGLTWDGIVVKPVEVPAESDTE